MRRTFIIIFLVSFINLFAQEIPIGTKSIGMSSLIIDFKQSGTHFELGFEPDLSISYFIKNNLEVFFNLGVTKVDIEAKDSHFDIALGSYYHYPLTNNFYIFTGAMVGYNNSSFSLIHIPIDIGIEVFITKNTALRVWGRYLFYFNDYINEYKDNTEYLKFGLATYF